MDSLSGNGHDFITADFSNPKELEKKLMQKKLIKTIILYLLITLGDLRPVKYQTLKMKNF